MPGQNNYDTLASIETTLGETDEYTVYAEVINGVITPTQYTAGSPLNNAPIGLIQNQEQDDEGGSTNPYIARNVRRFAFDLSGTATQIETFQTAVLRLTYSTDTEAGGGTNTTLKTTARSNSGTRSVSVHIVPNWSGIDTTPPGDDKWLVQYAAELQSNKAWTALTGSYLQTDYGIATITGTIVDNTHVDVDIMPLMRKWLPTYIKTPLGNGLGYGTDLTTLTVVIKMFAESTVSTNCIQISNADIIYTSIVDKAPATAVTTDPVSATTVPVVADVVFSATVVNQVNDHPTSFDLVVSERSDFGSPTVNINIPILVSPITTSLPLLTFKPNAKYYWRVRSYDIAGLVSAWSSSTNFFTPSVTGWVGPVVSPTQVSSPRNKYRLEFYPLLTNLAGFDPNPCAVIFDAKAIGVSQTVNSTGEFFFTITSDHEQIGKVLPGQTLWRACRWDERVSYYRVIGEGLITSSEITPHEVIFYGVDKIGMLNRVVVSADKIASTDSHTGTITSIHEQILRKIATPSLSVSGFAGGTKVTSMTATANTFAVGDILFFTNFVSPINTGITKSAVGTVTVRSSNSITVGNHFYDTEVISPITDSLRNSPALGQVTYTCTNPHLLVTGNVVTITGFTNTALNVVGLTVNVLSPTTFWIQVESVTTTLSSQYTSTAQAGKITIVYTSATATIAKRVTDLGWGTSPATTFKDYTITNSGYTTATESKSVKISGERAANALATVADVLMGGTSDKVIIENPNVGQPAIAVTAMDTGLRYRHLKVTDVVKPAWWFQYGVNVKNFMVKDNLDKMATRAIVINRNLDSSTTSLYNNGTLSEDIYPLYGVVDSIEIINEERNDIEWSKQLAYNLHPDRMFTIETDVIPNTISPFANYAVGDDITVYLVHKRANVAKDLTIVGQQWIGNANGAEYLMLSFAPRITQSFKIPKKKKVKEVKDPNAPWDGRGDDPNAPPPPEDDGGLYYGHPWEDPDSPTYDPELGGGPQVPEDIWYDGPWTE